MYGKNWMFFAKNYSYQTIEYYENTESHIPIIIIISLECMYNLPTEYTKNEIEHEKGTYHDERHKI